MAQASPPSGSVTVIKAPGSGGTVLLSSTEILPLTTAQWGLSSTSKSPFVMANPPATVLNVFGLPNVPLPLPKITESSLPGKCAAARSSAPSPLKSAIVEISRDYRDRLGAHGTDIEEAGVTVRCNGKTAAAIAQKNRNAFLGK